MNIPLRKRVLATEIAVIRAGKTTEDFEEEKRLNHIKYACREWLEYMEKKDGSSSSS